MYGRTTHERLEKTKILCPWHLLEMDVYKSLSVVAWFKQMFNPLKGRDVNWLHFAIQV